MPRFEGELALWDLTFWAERMKEEKYVQGRAVFVHNIFVWVHAFLKI
jgi:hypothetical protein